MSDKFKTYLFSYNFEDSKWGFSIKARSPEEARQRVGRLNYATYDGELMATIPVGGGPLVRLVCWFRNLVRA